MTKKHALSDRGIPESSVHAAILSQKVRCSGNLCVFPLPRRLLHVSQPDPAWYAVPNLVRYVTIEVGRAMKATLESLPRHPGPLWHHLATTGKVKGLMDNGIYAGITPDCVNIFEYNQYVPTIVDD